MMSNLSVRYQRAHVLKIVNHYTSVRPIVFKYIFYWTNCDTVYKKRPKYLSQNINPDALIDKQIDTL